MLRWASLVVGILWMGATGAQFEKTERTVRDALARDKPYKAIAKSEAALAKKDAPAVFHVLRADGYIRIGAYGKALRDARRAADLLGPTSEVRSQLIGAYLGLGMVDSAMLFVTGTIGPDVDAEYLFRTGTAYQRSQDWNKALAVFDAGVQRFPEAARMARERGSCHAMLGDTARARIDFDKAIALAPREAVNYNSRGVHLYAMYGDHTRAVEDMDRAIRQDPNYGYAFSNRGWSEYKLGQVDKARKDLQLAIRKNPGNAYAYRGLGIIELEVGDREKGCAYLQDALENGFTASFGTEVEDLKRTHCVGAVPSPLPGGPVPRTTPPPSNAPGGKAPRKGNAP